MSRIARLSVCALALALALGACFRFMPGAANAYAERVLTPLSERPALVRASLSEPLALALSAMLLLMLASRVGRRLALLSVCLLTLGYAALWMPLYFTAPCAEPCSGSLDAFCTRLIDEANALSPCVAEASFEAVLDEAGNRVSLALGRPVRAPKKMRFSACFHALGVSGVYVPWTGEALVSECELRAALPFTACHEAAHSAGYAREREASLIAWRSCMSGDASFRYSGVTTLLWYAMDELREADPQAWLRACDAMNDGVRRDFALADGYAVRDARPAERAQRGVTDAFLRMQGNGGVSDYAAVVYLVMSEYDLG